MLTVYGKPTNAQSAWNHGFVDLYDCTTLSDAIMWCEKYTLYGDWGGYEYFIISACNPFDEVTEGFFVDNGMEGEFEPV